jgi:hypothetical protein
MGPLTYFLIGLLAAFGVADVIAHVTKYRYGETFSKWDIDLERKHTWFKILNVAVLAVLIAHLAFNAI